MTVCPLLVHPSSQILIEPILFRYLSSDPFFIGLINLLNLIISILSPSSSFIRHIDPCDLLVAHAVSLGLHVILLIVFKGPLTLKVPKFLPISLLLAIFFFVMVLKRW